MAVAAMGTQLKIASAAVAKLTSISGLELSADTIDVTALDSTGGYREFIAGMKDAGEVSISGFFNPADTNGQKALYDAFIAGTVLDLTILFPSSLGAQWDFDGVVVGFSTGAELEDAVTFEATIKVSGAPTLATTASADLTGLAMAGTGGTFAPTFGAGIYSYVFTGVTAASVTVTATSTTHEMKLYVDGAFVQNLTTEQASAGIAMTIGTKKLTILCKEATKATKTYEIIVHKVS